MPLHSVSRDLARLVEPHDLPDLRQRFERDLDGLALVSVDRVVCESAGDIGDQLGVRSSDAIHLASARRLQVPGLSFLTFDLRQAQAARSLGFTVLGA